MQTLIPISPAGDFGDFDVMQQEMFLYSDVSMSIEFNTKACITAQNAINKGKEVIFKRLGQEPQRVYGVNIYFDSKTAEIYIDPVSILNPRIKQVWLWLEDFSFVIEG